MVKNRMRPIHPGEILKEEFLTPLGITLNVLASALGLTLTLVEGVVKEEQDVSPELALRLARYFGTTPEFWLDLQTAYMLRKAEQLFGAIIQEEVQPLMVNA
jgi:addiction module HigA family antidote